MRQFNAQFNPVFLENRPDKPKRAAGLACGTIWRVSKDFKVGDRVLCPDGDNTYYIGEITGGYFYKGAPEAVWINPPTETGNLP